MLSLYLDPFIFSCPDVDGGDFNEFSQFVDNIIAWQVLSNATWANVLISDKTIDILFETSSYPLWNDLKNAINILGLENVQAKDIVNLVDGLLKKLPTIEDRVKIRAMLIDNYACIPSYHLDGRPHLFIENHQLITMFMSLFCHLTGENSKNQVFITRNLKEHSINLSGQIIDCEFIDTSFSVDLPLVLSNNFPACTNPHILKLLTDPIIIWQNASTEDAIRIAVDTFVYQIINGSEGSQSQKTVLSWSIGSKFLETAIKTGFFSEENKIKMLLRAISETILQENMNATHWLRTGKGANAPQRGRDSDGSGAWRRDIDRDHHLHYWQIENWVEFASIAYPHDDMSIPE